MTSTAPAVVADGLTKSFAKRVAVDHLSFSIPTGVTAGMIGPNGAGKTTTMGMLLGLVRPTSGRATVLGEPIDSPHHYLSRVGALVEGPAFWPTLTGRENLRLLARLAGHDERGMDALLDLVALRERANDRFGSYSLGMKQRLGIAAALVGDPQLLILDEPTNGLDPAGIADMRNLIRDIASTRTVLVSSHILVELEAICDWLVVIGSGRLLYSGEADGFSSGTAQLVLGPLDRADVPALASLARQAGFEARTRPDDVTIELDRATGRKVAAQLNRAAATAGIVLAEVHLRRATLEMQYLDMLANTESVEVAG